MSAVEFFCFCFCFCFQIFIRIGSCNIQCISHFIVGLFYIWRSGRLGNTVLFFPLGFLVFVSDSHTNLYFSAISFCCVPCSVTSKYCIWDRATWCTDVGNPTQMTFNTQARRCSCMLIPVYDMNINRNLDKPFTWTQCQSVRQNQTYSLCTCILYVFYVENNQHGKLEDAKNVLSSIQFFGPGDIAGYKCGK